MAPIIEFRNPISRDGCVWVKGSPRATNTKLVEDTTVVTKVLKRWDHAKSRLSGYYITDGWEPDPNADLPVKDWEESPHQDSSEEPALFRIFANLPADADSLVEFVNRWGLLWHLAVSGKTTPLYREGDEYRPGHSMAAEAAEHWMAEINRMRRAVRLWDLINERHEPSIVSFLEHSRKIDGLGFPELYHHQETSGGRGTSAEIQRELSRISVTQSAAPLNVGELLESGEIIQAARAELASMVDDASERVFSLMLWPRDDDAWETSIAPDCLLDFLWLQFAHAIAGDVRFQSCIECGAWFIVAPGRGREDKKFCSDACRMRAYRKRKIGAKSATVCQTGDKK